MLIKEIKWTDFDGNERREKFYFNMSKSELVKLELSRPGGFRNYITRLMEAQNGRELMEVFDDMMLKSYGVRSDDGRNFRKGAEYYEDFKSTGAYDELFMELMQDDKAMEHFINGLMPPDIMAEAMKEAQKQENANKLNVIEGGISPVSEG